MPSVMHDQTRDNQLSSSMQSTALWEKEWGENTIFFQECEYIWRMEKKNIYNYFLLGGGSGGGGTWRVSAFEHIKQFDISG